MVGDDSYFSSRRITGGENYLYHIFFSCILFSRHFAPISTFMNYLKISSIGVFLFSKFVFIYFSLIWKMEKTKDLMSLMNILDNFYMFTPIDLFLKFLMGNPNIYINVPSHNFESKSLSKIRVLLWTSVHNRSNTFDILRA